MDLILASTSPYRKQLLQRLQLPFRCVAPEVPEPVQAGESAPAMALRLARAKSRAVAARFPQALVIGSDQVAARDGQLLGKPGSHAAASAQLRASSGRSVHFHTGLTLSCRERELELSHVEPFTVTFRRLGNAQIDHYLRREQAWDCAGSFKVEGLGIALFTATSGRDPSALEGLPLIALCGLLERAGLPVLGSE